jgi:hypothetical protein
MARRLLILVGILAVLWGGWYLYSTSEREALSVPERTDFFWVDTTKVDSIAMKYADWNHLSKEGDKWMYITDTYRYPADEDLLSRIISTTNNMVLENVISTNAAKFDKFEVDTARGRIMRFFEKGQPVAEFVIGKLGAGYTKTYVRQLQSDTVYLARGRFQQLFTMIPDQWKSRIIFDIEPFQVDTIHWIYPDAETYLARAADNQWMVWEPGKQEPQPADTAAVSGILGEVAPLRIANYHPDSNPKHPSFDTLSLQLIVVTTDHKADTVIYNKPGEKEGRVFAKRPGTTLPIFLFHKTAYDDLALRFDDLVFKDTTAAAAATP